MDYDDEDLQEINATAYSNGKHDDDLSIFLEYDDDEEYHVNQTEYDNDTEYEDSFMSMLNPFKWFGPTKNATDHQEKEKLFIETLKPDDLAPANNETTDYRPDVAKG